MVALRHKISDTEIVALSHGTQQQFDDETYHHWVRLLERRTGVVVSPQRRQFLESKIRQRIREIGIDSPEAYLASLKEGPLAAQEWATLVDRLTVHETHFFRHVPSYEIVRDRIVREYLKNLNSGRADHPFHVWSIGCSTGEEVYSLAMMLDQMSQAQLRPFHYGVTGTDVSQPSLKVAKNAIYSLDRILEVPEMYRSRYCSEQENGQFRIKDSIRKRVGFAALNLMEIRSFPIQKLDLIFCHNVLIYFSVLRRQEILHHMARYLRPGGYLVLSPGEISHWSHPEMQQVKHHRTLAYQRLDEEKIQ